MAFSEDLDKFRAAQQRTDRVERAAAKAQRAAYDSAFGAARADFIEKANEATALLREKGAPARRVVSIHFGLHGIYQINAAHSYTVIAIGGMAVHDDDIIFGQATTAGVRSIWHRLRKGSQVFNTDASGDTHLTLAQHDLDDLSGKLQISSTDWDGRTHSRDAYTVLLEATAAELQRLERARH